MESQPAPVLAPAQTVRHDNDDPFDLPPVYLATVEQWRKAKIANPLPPNAPIN